MSPVGLYWQLFFDVTEFSIPASVPLQEVDFQIVNNKCWHTLAVTGFFS